MRVVQFEIPESGRRVGIVHDDEVLDITSRHPTLQRSVDLFDLAQAKGVGLEPCLRNLAGDATLARHPYFDMLAACPGERRPFLHPAVDHPDGYRVHVAGTGLTHLGSMQSRDSMHAEPASDDATKSDSRRMFEMGLREGRPAEGCRGVPPEWFYKGNGGILRGHRQSLELPAFALDGGEEPEIVGCYVIDACGVPRRLGFSLGNEWSDHATEKLNYLYLAPSKLRQCAVGPELVTDSNFEEITLHCRVRRDGAVIYDSGPLLSGQRHMCHSLANCEDHHFKYPQHRRSGDVHLHFFGTSKLSHGSRDWKYADGDEVEIEAPGFSGTLINTGVAPEGSEHTGDMPVRVEPA